MTLKFRNIAKHSSGETLIHPCSFTFEAPGFNILLNATNADKTTLIKLMANLERPSDGEIWFDGANISRVATHKRNVSMVHHSSSTIRI